MSKSQKDELSLVEIPVRLQVHTLSDGTVVSHVNHVIRVILYDTHILKLKKDLNNKDRPAHALQKHNAAAYVRRELLPKEPQSSPVHLPDTWVEVIIQGDISTWKITPYTPEKGERGAMVS